MPLSSVNNLTVKDCVIAKMAAELKDGAPRFSPKSITNYVQIVKMVVASAVDEKGEEIYPVKWKNDFMDLPVIEGQNKPSFTAEEITTILSEAEGQYQLLFALLAGTGLRIGEAFALRVEDIRGAVIRVRHSHWNGRLYSPKTKNAIREIDLHSSLAEALHDHIAGRTEGFVFETSAGTPLHQSNVLRRSLHPILEKIGRETCGFHSFRRFRVTHLRKCRVPATCPQWHRNCQLHPLHPKLRLGISW